MNNQNQDDNCYHGFNYEDHFPNGENPFKDFARWLTSINPYEYAALSAILGIIISSGLTVPEQNSIGNWLEAVGQIILAINAQANVINPSTNNTQYQVHNNRLDELEKELEKLKKRFSNY